ncbi:MAG: hypothetical protein QM778_22355 [Myxococcales bacterium]
MEKLPFDRDGRWFAFFGDTSWLILREPYRVFSKLADESAEPAWRFAASWGIVSGLLLVAVSEALGAGRWGMLLLAGIAGMLRDTLLWSAGSLFLWGLMRMLGATTSWSMAARVVGYAAAWTGPELIIQAVHVWAVLAPSAVWAWVCWSLGFAVSIGTSAFAIFAFARGRSQFSPQRAVVAATLGVAPGVALKVASLLVTLNMMRR